jgi:hypothetical protein
MEATFNVDCVEQRRSVIMKNTLVVVADLGCLKAYRLGTTPHHTPRLELLEQHNNTGASARLGELTTDASGRFARGAARLAHGMSDGERHNIGLEHRKRLVRQLAGILNRVLRREGIDECYLAASCQIHNLLMDALDPSARAMIVHSVSADLTKFDKSQLLAHLQPDRRGPRTLRTVATSVAL